MPQQNDKQTTLGATTPSQKAPTGALTAPAKVIPAASTPTPGAYKSGRICPLTLTRWMDRAQAVTVQIGDHSFLVPAKEFSTGSFGHYLSAKVTLTVDGVAVPCQVGLSITAVGSKDAPRS